MQWFAYFLSCDLYQIQPGHIDYGCLHRISGALDSQRLHQKLLILFFFHINKIHQNNAGKITKAHLMTDFCRSLQIDL